MKVPTSGSAGFAAAVAAVGSLQPASSGAIAVNIKTMHTDCVRSPDIEGIAPVQVGKRELSIRGVVARDLGNSRLMAYRIGRACCDAIRFHGGPMSHNATALNYRRFFGFTQL